MGRIKKVDKNQSQVVKELRELGFSVELTHIVGKGFPDFIVGFGDIFTIPVELKSDKGTLTDDEKIFHERYQGYIIVAYNTDDVLNGIVEFLHKINALF